MNTQTSLTSQVAGRVQDAMTAASVSQVRLSEDTGIPRATLIRRLRGQSAFAIDELEAIAKALGCPVGDLLPVEAA